MAFLKGLDPVKDEHMICCNGGRREVFAVENQKNRDNRPLAATSSCNLLFIKLWAATLRIPEMEKAC